MRRKGAAFHLAKAGRVADIYSGLLHFRMVWQLKHLQYNAADGDDEELRQAVANLHGKFWQQTQEVNDPEKKLKSSLAMENKKWMGRWAEVTSDWPEFSRSEVALHSARDDCWLVVRKRVYDVSSWVGSHPGGAAVLLSQGGQDATASFLAAEHTVVGFRILQKHQVGVVCAEGELVSAEFEAESGRRARPRSGAQVEAEAMS
jgi:cytochrome b involved in lipid metabolism